MPLPSGPAQRKWSRKHLVRGCGRRKGQLCQQGTPGWGGRLSPGAFCPRAGRWRQEPQRSANDASPGQQRGAGVGGKEGPQAGLTSGTRAPNSREDGRETKAKGPHRRLQACYQVTLGFRSAGVRVSGAHCAPTRAAGQHAGALSRDRPRPPPSPDPKSSTLYPRGHDPLRLPGRPLQVSETRTSSCDDRAWENVHTFRALRAFPGHRPACG